MCVCVWGGQVVQMRSITMKNLILKNDGNDDTAMMIPVRVVNQNQFRAMWECLTAAAARGCSRPWTRTTMGLHVSTTRLEAAGSFLMGNVAVVHKVNVYDMQLKAVTLSVNCESIQCGPHFVCE